MYQIIEKDWKLFRKLLPGWQEAYMDRLMKEYLEILTSNKLASDKFWELDKRIREDKRCYGVVVSGASRSKLFYIIIGLLGEGAITENDLLDFSEDLQENVKLWFEIESRSVPE